MTTHSPGLNKYRKKTHLAFRSDNNSLLTFCSKPHVNAKKVTFWLLFKHCNAINMKLLELILQLEAQWELALLCIKFDVIVHG